MYRRHCFLRNQSRESPNLRILIAGPVKSTDEYKSWILDEMSAEVQLIENPGGIMTILDDDAWDLLIIEGIAREQRIHEIVRSIKEVQPKLPIIALCEDEPQEAIEVMRLGVSDYLVKPVMKERLLTSLQEVSEADSKKGLASLPYEADGEGESLKYEEPLPENVIFEGSSQMAAVGQVVDKIINVDLPVLISGESGTGKEIVAKYIYNKSKRKGPFIKVNCAAIPSELLESELFGYERGAFTGAYRRKPGKFEAASGGFLFLDEISELPYLLQSKLLHVLQDGTVSTLGSTREVKVDVRIIVATNQDLEVCVQRGTFRDDLFFRLNVVHINVPPLRERMRQLEILIEYFREKFAKQYNTTPVHLDDDAKSFLFSYRWPGNIRELENTIRRATVLGGNNLRGNISGLDQITFSQPPEMMPTDSKRTEHKSSNPDEADPRQHSEDLAVGNELPLFKDMNLKEIAKDAALAAEREAIARVLQQTRWNRKKTAKILGVSYKTLLTKIKETGLDEK